jgi:CPA2 family monovalent cation:H+ antiporter-2
MENDTSLLLDLVAAMGVALAGGWLASRFGLSSIVGYVLAGMVISPFTPGFVGDIDRLRFLADIGVVLIMFGIGVQFSIGDLARVGPKMASASVAQVLIVLAAAWAVSGVMGWEWDEALFVGIALASSSSTVIAKVLAERGEVSAAHGRVAMSWSIVQDLAALIVVAVLLALTEEGDVGSSVALTAAQAVGFIAVLLIVGARVVPWLLARVADQGSRELFVLTIAGIALGTAMASEQAGLSLAMGAFLAGMIVSESDLSHRVLGELLPARDVFAVLFFVSVGMLIEPDVVLENLGPLVVILALIIVFKGVLIFGLLRFAGERRPTSLQAAALLAQAGEFTFVFVGLGVDQDVVSAELFSVVVAATAISIIVMPLISAAATRLNMRLESTPVIAPVVERPRRRIGRKAVVAGYGAVGHVVVGALRSRFEVIVVDEDARVLRDLQDSDVRTVNGDASNPAVMDDMELDDCRVLVVALSDPFAARRLVERARAMYPDLDIIARAANEIEASKLRDAGAADAIVPEGEVALELVRHSLHRFGVDQRQALAVVQRMRQQY